MGISEIYIVKRDGKRAPFSLEKIKRAISKAFLSVGGYATDDDLTSVLSRVHILSLIHISIRSAMWYDSGCTALLSSGFCPPTMRRKPAASS